MGRGLSGLAILLGSGLSILGYTGLVDYFDQVSAARAYGYDVASSQKITDPRKTLDLVNSYVKKVENPRIFFLELGTLSCGLAIFAIGANGLRNINENELEREEKEEEKQQT